MALNSDNTSMAGKGAADKSKARGTLAAKPAFKLVPVVILVSEAGLGLRKGEIRGVTPDVAERMVKAGSGEIWTKGAGAAAQDKVKAEALKELQQSDKGLA